MCRDQLLTRTLADGRYSVVETILSKRIQKWLAVLLLLTAPLAFAQSGSFVVSDIRVEGLQRISAGSVFAAMPLAVGDTVTFYFDFSDTRKSHVTTF